MIRLSIELSHQAEPVVLADVLPDVFAQYLPEMSQRVAGEDGDVVLSRYVLRTAADLLPSLG